MRWLQEGFVTPFDPEFDADQTYHNGVAKSSGLHKKLQVQKSQTASQRSIRKCDVTFPLLGWKWDVPNCGLLTIPALQHGMMLQAHEHRRENHASHLVSLRTCYGVGVNGPNSYLRKGPSRELSLV